MVGVTPPPSGDMLKSIYDTDADGEADFAQFHAIPSDVLKDSFDTPVNKTGNTYTRVRRIKIPGDINSGRFRVKFDLYHGSGGAGFGRIYRNGYAHGTEHASTGAWVTKSEDLHFSGGDYIEFMYKSDGSHNLYVRNFRIYCDKVAALHDTWEDEA